MDKAVGNPEITVLMPVYNGEKYLKEAIESILNQTYANYEFLIINDCSSDNSKNIITAYSDPRIKYIENDKNYGLIYSLNKGIDCSKGEYIVRMDQDDISLSYRFEKQINYMERHKEVGICGSWVKYFGEQRNVFITKEAHESICCGLLFENVMAHPTIIFRKSLLGNCQLRYMPGYDNAEDYELWVRASKLTRLANIPEILLKYRTHRTNTFKRMSSEQIAVFKRIVHQALSNFGISFSPKELRAHISLSMLDFHPSKEMIVELEHWLLKLLKYNRENKMFIEFVCSNVMLERWLMVCKKATRLRFWILSKCLSSPLWKEAGLSLGQKIGFIVKYFVYFVKQQIGLSRKFL